MNGYKLLLVPEAMITQDQAERTAGQARVLAIFTSLGQGNYVGPFEVIADVAENRQLRMSRSLYETIEVVEPAHDPGYTPPGSAKPTATP